MIVDSERIDLGNGIVLNFIKTNKFKSNILSYYFVRPLARREITYNALIPLVLKRGSSNYPRSLDIDKKLEELYGANLSMGVNKRGEKQILRYSIQWVGQEYANQSNLDKEAVAMLNEIVFNPLVEDEKSFKSDYVEAEKKNLNRMIQSKILDKREYAIDRCIEAMCKNERFANYTLGYSEDIDGIDSQNLYLQYLELIDKSPLEVIYVGEYDEEIISYMKNIFTKGKRELVYIKEDSVINSVQTKNMVRESLDVEQGKLVVGYRSGIRYDDELYPALVMANTIFGRGSKSKLFDRVREKESLAYYISSSLNKYKSIILVDSGIEFDKFDEVLDLVKEELNKLKEGSFSQEDIDIALSSISSSLKASNDSLFSIAEYRLSQALSGDFRNPEDKIEIYKNVEKGQIIKAINTLNMDTIYFLTNNNDIWSD